NVNKSVAVLHITLSKLAYDRTTYPINIASKANTCNNKKMMSTQDTQYYIQNKPSDIKLQSILLPD
ncbi:hypothetical protein BDB00DRAFT_853252, partial [Zychaea mexicana]|uniref:uncharacterized protein n=1 Tax=Zychaea mexicana TaxID=64656 RepID=UPI0022FE5FE0